MSKQNEHTPRVAVVIPNWNGEDLLADCLESLGKQTQKARVVVVDNGSSDGSVELIRNRFPEVELIELPHNRGFAGGVNAGIKSVLDETDYIALFNNDAVAEPDWLARLVETAERLDEAGIVTGKLLQKQPSGTIDSVGEAYSTWGFPFPTGRGETDAGQYNNERWVFGATGGASLYRTRLLRTIGLFDDDFFAYYEDVDLSFRAQLAGWKVRYQPAARAHHLVGATSGRRPGFARQLTIRNFQYLYFKNMPGWLLWKYLPLFVAATLLQLGHSLSSGQTLGHLKAWGQALAKLSRTLRKRRSIQRKRRASTGYIDSVLFHGLPPTQRRLLALRNRLLG